MGLLLARYEPDSVEAVLGEFASDPRLPPFIRITAIANMQTMRAGEVKEELIQLLDSTASSGKGWT